MSDTTSSAGNDLTYGHHTHESHAFESPTRAEVVEAAASQNILDSSPSEPPKPARRAPISWLRRAAAEIEAKKRNPNPKGTRHSNNHSSSHTPSPHAMSEVPSGKLQQKDFTPEVDELLPQATALAQVESLQASSRSHL